MNTIIKFSGLFLFFGTVNAQINVPEVQKSLYGIVAATWCGNCGQTGIPTTAAIVDQVGDKGVFFELHKTSASALHSPTAENIANEIGTAGQPFWTLNGTAIGGYNSTLQASIINTINTTYNATEADVNAGFEWFIKDDTMYVETLTEFFNPANGEYNVAVYLSEDSVYEYQANYDPAIPSGNIYHSHILRTSLSQDAFGLQATTGTINTGETFTNYHKVKVDPNWDLDHVHLSTVVWKVDNGSYTFINANDSGEENLTASIDDKELNEIELTVFPNPASDVLMVSTKGIKNNYLIELYDLNGRLIYVTDEKGNGDTSISINVSEFKTGKYILSVISDGIRSSQSVVLK